jgi:hypothetical protein
MAYVLVIVHLAIILCHTLYQLHTHINPRKARILRPLADVVILVLSIPVLAIAFVSITIYYAVYSVINIFSGRAATDEETPFREEVMLLDKTGLKITLIEDISDDELTTANDNWASTVYGGDTNLYRVATDPVLPLLHGSICCFFTLEIDEELILQQVVNQGETRLLSINTRTHEITDLGSAGKFYLYRDEQKPTRIRGLNYDEEITIDLLPQKD